jgi:hypothetical protein
VQHARGKNVILLCVLEWVADDTRREWSLQLAGRQAARELPGILDQVITMNFVDFDDGAPPIRAFVCGANSWGFPGGDRSGRLNQIEEPHLGKLLEKLTGPGERKSFITSSSEQTPTE